MNRHDKSKAYWESIGKPKLEFQFIEDGDSHWMECLIPSLFPDFVHFCNYRIAGDSHWELRQKWIDSDKKLRIMEMDNDGWIDVGNEPNWWQSTDYKEESK